jgi:hypothetical protein
MSLGNICLTSSDLLANVNDENYETRTILNNVVG